ncbi:hypothetical protein [Mycoplasmopsis caviae]|uniref:Uncharacterized protein n=1 Tax=Mycoplasmopsis caviae TaxID=55603 RepID=A0A3P8MF71_9BACT|nr:hypothetical protein [Mycoplasmopsis caviae]VDR41803.1 Uncharacterised protein [Mycoplasmopsis caviae]
MKKRDKKIISISAGIAGGIVGTISLGAIVALSVDKTNYRNNKKWLEDQIKNFNGSSLKLRDSRDRINKTISSFNLMDEIKSQLNNILNVYNNQIDKNNKLSIEIQKILDEHKKYRIGHHFGNTSYLRATKNKNAYDLINKTIPEVELKNKEILEQEESDLFIKIVDEVEKKAKELESLRNSNNTIINSISNKVSRFNNLKKAIENYDKSKIDPGVQNNKKLTGSLVEAGLNLMNVDNKLWKDTILSSINIKNTLNDQQINQILNSENLKKVANTTKLDLTEIETIKKSINNYFEQDGKINENAIENRTKTLTELATTKEKINKLRNESLIHYNYAKSRLLAFKDSYTTKQNQLIDFNQFGFTYSLLSSQLIEVDKILTSINKLNISSNKIDLKDILDCLVNIGQLITVDLNNNNIIKNSVVSNADRLISACKISTEITDFKPLLELEESIEHKKIIDTNSNNITSKEIDKWDTNNIDIVKTSFTNIFNYIEQINTNVIELSKLKTEYMKFLDTVKNNMDNLIRISNVNEIVSEKNITSKNTLLLKAKKDYLEVNNKNDFKSKISSSEKVKKKIIWTHELVCLKVTKNTL